jgi:CBS domain-containing protein
MKVQEIMTREVKSCGPDTNLAAAAEILWRNDCGTLPVVDSDGKPVGIVTDRDMCIALGTRNRVAADLAVRDVATKPVLACGPNDDIREALKTMAQFRVRRLLVLGEDGKVAGIFSLDDVAAHAAQAGSRKATEEIQEALVSTIRAIRVSRTAEPPKTAAMGSGAAPV